MTSHVRIVKFPSTANPGLTRGAHETTRRRVQSVLDGVQLAISLHESLGVTTIREEEQTHVVKARRAPIVRHSTS